MGVNQILSKKVGALRMIISTGSFLLFAILFLVLPVQSLIDILLKENHLLTFIQGALVVFFPILCGSIGMVLKMSPQLRTTTSAKIFSLWFDRKRNLIFAFLMGCVALSVVVNALSSQVPERSLVHAVFLALPWLLISISFDGLYLSFRAIDLEAEPKNLLITLRQEIVKTSKERDMSRFIVLYETLLLYCRDLATTQDPLSVKAAQEEIIKTIRASLDALPKMTLFQSGSTEETLLDRLHFFEALAARKLSTLTRELIASNFDNGGSLSSGSLEVLFQVTMKMFLIFHENHATLGFMLLNSVRQAVVDSMKKGYSASDIEIFSSQFAVAVSESIKSIMDLSLRSKQNYSQSISKLLVMLESVMKEQFRYNRAMNPALLMQPFAEIGQEMAYEKYTSLIDRDQILSQLKQIMSQFAILETISERLDIQGSPTDTAASYKEDLPFSGANDFMDKKKKASQ